MGVKLQISGFRELRTLPEIEDYLMEKAERVARAAGDGFVAEKSPGKNRARATVTPNTIEAAVETARHPYTLIGAMNAARHG